jgi:hypothetical protein
MDSNLESKSELPLLGVVLATGRMMLVDVKRVLKGIPWSARKVLSEPHNHGLAV